MDCKFCPDQATVMDDDVRIGKCYEHCQEATDGKHEAGLHTLYAFHDDTGIYVDVNCRLCGQSGCVGRFDFTEVTWD